MENQTQLPSFMLTDEQGLHSNNTMSLSALQGRIPEFYDASLLARPQACGCSMPRGLLHQPRQQQKAAPLVAQEPLPNIRQHATELL